MSKARTNILVAEDDPHWRRIYREQAEEDGFKDIYLAKSLAEATKLIDDIQFGVAFVDIGLDLDNDRNVDGLEVMDKIRSLGDQTSIIAVTGRSGSDVLSIVRNVMKEYQALDTVAKPEANPAIISNLLEEAVRAFHEKYKRPPAREVLRGAEMAWDWDDKVLRVTGIRGGAERMYKFLDRLFSAYLPAVPERDIQGMEIHPHSNIAYGRYWSRAIGRPVFVYFGLKSAIESAAGDPDSAPHGMLNLREDDLLSQASNGDVEGYVYAIREATRSEFSEMVK
jgi:CheY-like chemotaxis protein